MRERLTLRRRLAAVTAVVLALLAVGGVIVGLSADRLQNAIHQKADVVTPSQVAASRLLATLVDQETGVRGYLLQGRPLFLAPYTGGRAEEARLTATLTRLLAGDGDAEAAFAVVQRRADDWHRLYAEPAIAAARAGGTTAGVAVDPQLGKPRFDSIRNAETDLDRILGARGVAARHRVSGALRVLVGLLIGVAVAAAALLALLFWGLRSWVTGPLRSLGGDARTVAAGELEHPVTPAGPPDVADLARDVEKMRRQLLAELTAARAATAALADQAHDLRRSNRDLEQFAYVASHDLQEPLRKVASFCQLLERRYGDQLDERATQYIAFAVDGAKRMQQLINDLLAFSRVGRTTDKFVEVPLEAALARARASLSSPLDAAGAEISADPLPTVLGDPSLLAQLFQNLIANAVKFRAEASPRIHVGAVEQGDEWELSCADNGIGIEPEYAEKIFVIFQRLHGRDAYEGTGIGLALCRKIVEFHGGRIWLDTAATGGTTFRWTIPAVRVDEPTADQRTTSTPAQPADSLGGTA